jgi:ATP-dependent Lhr-like helicase
LLLATGICRLWGQAWVEAAFPPPAPWAIIAQQILVATLERSQWPVNELAAMLLGAFPECSIDGIAEVIDHMVGLGFLIKTKGLLQIGPTTEKIYGRAHYRDLLASFTGAQLLLGRYGKVEVGFIDPTMLTGDKQNRLILLAGKSWLIVDVDWKRQTVWLEPAKEGGKARWTGSGRNLSRAMAQAIMRAVHDGAGEHTIISKRARVQLDQIAKFIPDLGADTFVSLVQEQSGAVRLWSFAGTRANRTIAKQVQCTTEIKRIDALGLDLRWGIDTTEVNFDLAVEDLPFSVDEVKDCAKPIKFSNCVPATLLLEIIRLRQFEPAKARATEPLAD